MIKGKIPNRDEPMQDFDGTAKTVYHDPDKQAYCCKKEGCYVFITDRGTQTVKDKGRGKLVTRELTQREITKRVVKRFNEVRVK